MLQRLGHITALSFGLTLTFSPAPAHADSSAPSNSIYSCVDASGKRLTSDRPIRECIDREQRVLNRDGSQKRVMPPSLTADEKSAAEEQQRKREAELAARQDAIKRDRNLLARFPNEEAHNKAREASLDDVHNAIRLSELRLDQLKKDRKPLEAEAEFYKGHALPGKLRTLMEQNEVTAEAQEALIQNQRAELARINALYDNELMHLRKLWAGAMAGSLPYSPAPASAAASNITTPASAPAATTGAAASASAAPAPRKRSGRHHISRPASSSAAR